MRQKAINNFKFLQVFSVGALGLCLVLLFSACSGSYTATGSGGNSTTIGSTTSQFSTLTGTVASVTGNSVTLTVQGKSITIHGLSASQIAMVQSQIGKIYTFHVTPNTDQSYNVTSDTNAVEPGDGTPEAQSSPNTQNSTSGSIAFVGPVQSISSNQASVKLPTGEVLSLTLNAQTDLSDFNGGRPTTGQVIKVKAAPSVGTGFTATKLSIADSGDQQTANQVTFNGLTTSAVGSDNTIHLSVGSANNYSFTITPNTEIKDFNNAQAIGVNQLVEVKVQYQGSTATLLEIKAGSAN